MEYKRVQNCGKTAKAVAIKGLETKTNHFIF